MAVGSVIALTALGVAGAALAGSKGKITFVRRSTAGATQLARSIFEGNSHLVQARFVAIPPDNDPVATSTKSLAGFPRHGKSYAILTTGCAHLASNPNNAPDSGCLDAGPILRGARDVTILRIRLQVPKGSNCLSFRFRYLSEEFPEFVGSIYNDAFIAELDHSNWDASGTTSPTIHAPRNFATTGNGGLISVNAAGVARVSAKNAKGTTYDGATRVLRASTPVTSGQHRLYLSIFDQGDRNYDSAVFIDHLTLTHHSGNGCHSGVASTQ
ncbi:MAG: choice-of-anchor L domain-containing protein [Solirubrobacteraceae bacterium]